MTAREFLLEKKITIPLLYVNDELADYYHKTFGEIFGIDYETYESIVDKVESMGADKVDEKLQALANFYRTYNGIELNRERVATIGSEKRFFDKNEIGQVYMMFYMPHSVIYEFYKDNIRKEVVIDMIPFLEDEKMFKIFSYYLFKNATKKVNIVKYIMSDYFSVLEKEFGINEKDICFSSVFESMFFRVSLKNINEFKEAIKRKMQFKNNVQFDVFKVVDGTMVYNAKNKKTIVSKYDDGMYVPPELTAYFLKKVIGDEINDNDRIIKCKNYLVKIIEEINN